MTTGKGSNLDEQWTCSVPEAGAKYYGLGRNASYEAAKNGQIPTVKVGGKIRALVKVIECRLKAGASDQL